MEANGQCFLRLDSPQVEMTHQFCSTIGHQHIDVLKIDLEGGEFQTMRTFLQPYLETEEPLPVGQLLIEFHTWDKHFPELLRLFKDMEAVGLRPFMRESNLIYTNYNRDSDQDLMEVIKFISLPLFLHLFRFIKLLSFSLPPCSIHSSTLKALIALLRILLRLTSMANVRHLRTGSFLLGTSFASYV